MHQELGTSLCQHRVMVFIQYAYQQSLGLLEAFYLQLPIVY